jgi:hypothetical protein
MTQAKKRNKGFLRRPQRCTRQVRIDGTLLKIMFKQDIYMSCSKQMLEKESPALSNLFIKSHLGRELKEKCLIWGEQETLQCYITKTQSPALPTG